MYEAKFDEANRVLIITATGKITADDIDTALDRLEASYPDVVVHLVGGDGHGIGMLLDWESLEGWERGAKVTGTIADEALSDIVRRCAIVAHEKWHGEVERIADIERKGAVRFFHPNERDAAWAWLTGA